MNPEVGPASMSEAGIGQPSQATRRSSAVRRSLAVGAGALIIALSAQVVMPVPFSPVPMTLQPLAVLAVGGLLGGTAALAALVLYMGLGLVGFPVFAGGGSGLLRLLGPTGGYLMSYPFAAFLTGLLAERGLDRRYATSVLAMGAGLAVVFTFGVVWLAWFARPAAGSLDLALRTGLYPFIPADIVKIFVAAAVMPALWKVTGNRRG